MKIKRIVLCNFGSYTGKNVFDMSELEDDARRIVLIGGKNGAGKTTLFSGIKLCLYGYKSSGFQTLNAFYRKEVRKSFNDVSKFDMNAECYVEVALTISNGHSEDDYVLKREWKVFSEKLEDFESFTVRKNGTELSEEEMGQFDNYLLNIIPPELFDLFFFDGEQIADYFLGENGSETVKKAFMVLCGYDTFDIIEKNFKRIAYGKSNNSADGTDYIQAKEQTQKLEKELEQNRNDFRIAQEEIDSLKAAIAELDKSYRLSGGVLRDEWNKKFLQLKEEERIREEKNNKLKRMANEVIPYIIVRDMLLQLREQIAKEQDKQKLQILQESLIEILPGVMNRVYEGRGLRKDPELASIIIDELAKEADKSGISKTKEILFLSSEESYMLIAAIEKYLSYGKDEVEELERELAESLQRSEQLRRDIDSANVDGEKDYLAERKKLEDELQKISGRQLELLEESQAISENLKEALQNCKKAEKKLEDELKSKSISDLSQRAVAFLDELQKRLYVGEIQKVEELFMRKVKQLARKNNFIDSVKIDTNFNVHIYKMSVFDLANVSDRISRIGEGKYESEYGEVHCTDILSKAKCETLTELAQKYQRTNVSVTALQEIEKSRLSKGEKQVFIMSLYWALVQLSKNQIPFIIDTPFARIDSEHRANITRQFFMDLKGQVFIFSTNEEIIDEYYESIKSEVGARFLLENIDNRSTTVIANKYFGE